ncbi:hypothetical protein L210DRAFT_877865 [Boletus edulis BED1]|uniref:Ribonuclease H1 N-terminal domain-containing protein n=1 Tax=Boletus edulis BED1 TaxID=1328754 RepID=A0AAD4BFI8_BOLED|nr:hypothetical protein L210DRAFT_877865 [Boletus edulis BED1]
MYNGFIYDVPMGDEPGHVYLVTKGRCVGIFHTWEETAPHVVGVRCACYTRVTSEDLAIMLMMNVVDRGEAEWVFY